MKKKALWVMLGLGVVGVAGFALRSGESARADVSVAGPRGVVAPARVETRDDVIDLAFELQGGARTNVAKPLGDLAMVLAKRGLVVVISDLLDDPEAVVRGLRQFRQRGTDVIVFHVLDPQELRFRFDDAARFRDVENARETFAEPGQVREAYLRAITGLIDTYRRELGGAGIDYHLLDTSLPLDLALVSYLNARSRS